MPGGYVCSASMKGSGSQRRCEGGGRRPADRKLFSKAQRAFYEAHAPEGLETRRSPILGPIFVLKLNVKPRGSQSGKLVTELWLYPDGARILELSGKCPPSRCSRWRSRPGRILTGQGVDLSGEQQTKTRTALEFFSTSAKEA